MTTTTPDAPPLPRTRRIVRSLRVRLTSDELRELGSSLAKACADVANEEASQKSAKTAMKNRLEGLTDARDRLARLVREEHDYRDVAVELLFDCARLVVLGTRTDTGEVIETRPMREDERQLDLLDDDDEDDEDEDEQALDALTTDAPTDDIPFAEGTVDVAAPLTEPVTDDERAGNPEDVMPVPSAPAKSKKH